MPGTSVAFYVSSLGLRSAAEREPNRPSRKHGLHQEHAPPETMEEEKKMLIFE
jgi:hypothetical protein